MKGGNSLIDRLQELRDSFLKDLPAVDSEPGLNEYKARFLGKKGHLTEVLKGMGALSAEERPAVGEKVNELKTLIETAVAEKFREVQNRAIEATLQKDDFDVTLPGRSASRGHLHPVTLVTDQARDIFSRLGFETHTGPEVEDDFHNFEALNIPADHPARDLQDTFYLPGREWLLRTHTSTVQIHVMEKQKPPIRMIAPGAVYRSDSDVTHTPMFHQIEGLWIDQSVTFADLKGVLFRFVQQMFGEDVRVRFRPSFFPFTEPSAEMDMTCMICHGRARACPVCKGTGWLEILGCGMVDPAVFARVNYDAEKYTGFAFGIGLERLAMLKFGINDLRMFFENDVRFLEQF